MIKCRSLSLVVSLPIHNSFFQLFGEGLFFKLSQVKVFKAFRSGVKLLKWKGVATEQRYLSIGDNAPMDRGKTISQRMEATHVAVWTSIMPMRTMKAH